LKYLQFLAALHGLAPAKAENETPESLPDMRTDASSIDQNLCLSRGILHPVQSQTVHLNRGLSKGTLVLPKGAFKLLLRQSRVKADMAAAQGLHGSPALAVPINSRIALDRTRI
jgi:hypothetical protein